MTSQPVTRVPVLPCTGTYRIDSALSALTSSRHMFGLGKVHAGSSMASGQLEVGGSAADCQVTATIAAASFASGNAKRDHDVMGPGLLDVAGFSLIGFTSTEMREGERGMVLIGVLLRMKEGSVLLIMSTRGPRPVQEVAAAAPADVQVLDVPVTGGVARAVTGELRLFASSSPEAVQYVQPVLTSKKGFRRSALEVKDRQSKVGRQLLHMPRCRVVNSNQTDDAERSAPSGGCFGNCAERCRPISVPGRS